MKIFVVGFLCLFYSTAYATTLERLFTENFYTLHIPNHCGKNIMTFLELASREHIDLSGAEIITVDSGWVEPLFVRNQGHKPKLPGSEGLTYVPGPRYFEFHVFLLHKNRVYDFDYGNSPMVHHLSTYMKRMWLTGKERDRFLGLKVYSAEDYLRRIRLPADIPTQPLLKFTAERTRR